MFTLGVRPMIQDLVKDLVESGVDPMDAIDEALDVMVQSVKDEVLDD